MRPGLPQNVKRIRQCNRAPAQRSNLRQGPGHHRITQPIDLRPIMRDPAVSVVEQSVQRCRIFYMQGDVIANRRQLLQFRTFMLKRKIQNHPHKTLNFSTLLRAAFSEQMPRIIRCNISINLKIWASVTPALDSVTHRKPKQKYREKRKRPPKIGGL